MTTIAWDGVSLAADKRAIYGDCIQVVTKIFRSPNGRFLMGGSGDLAFTLAMREWVDGGCLASNFPASQKDRDDWQPTLVIDCESRQVRIYERTPYPILWERRFGAIGSGKPYALAAMHMGATAEEAVKVACEFDAGSGNGIDVLRAEA